jgi:hypothetical protein
MIIFLSIHMTGFIYPKPVSACLIKLTKAVLSYTYMNID